MLSRPHCYHLLNGLTNRIYQKLYDSYVQFSVRRTFYVYLPCRRDSHFPIHRLHPERRSPVAHQSTVARRSPVTHQLPVSRRSPVVRCHRSRTVSQTFNIHSATSRCLPVKTKPVEVIWDIIPVALISLGDYTAPVHKVATLNDVLLVLRTGTE